MDDPSFILKGSDARDLREVARDLQALLDSRTAAIAQPVIEPDILLPSVDENPAPAGRRVGTGTSSILPYLVKTLAAKPVDHRG